MPEDRDRLVKVEARAEEAIRAIERQESFCRATAAEHVNIGLYASELAALRREVDRAVDRARQDTTEAAAALRMELARIESSEIARLETELERDRLDRNKKEEAWARQRRNLIIAGLTPTIGFVLTVGWFLLLRILERPPL